MGVAIISADVKRQMVRGTGIGDEAVNAYARALNMELEEYFARIRAPMPPREFGEKVISMLEDANAEGFAFGLKGDTGITIPEEVAA